MAGGDPSGESQGAPGYEPIEPGATSKSFG
jgi:hypothetical protein